MTLKTKSTYPSRRAYVLKLRSDAGPDSLAGRLENLVTGRQREFESGQALLDAIACDLQADTAGRQITRARNTDEMPTSCLRLRGDW